MHTKGSRKFAAALSGNGLFPAAAWFAATWFAATWFAAALFAASIFSAPAAHAQLQQPFVYTTGGAIATRSAAGVLAATADSPLAILGYPAVLDAKGRFLFAGGNDSVHMYRVDAVTGDYAEVAGSPFASTKTNGPILLATEPTGAYLAVVNGTGISAGESSVESFAIDAAGETLIPVSGSFVELVSSPVGAAANPALGTFFVYLGPNPSNPAYQQDGELLAYTIDPQTGLLGDETGATGSTDHGRSFGADPLGRFVVTGKGQLNGILQVTAAGGEQGVLSLGSGVEPEEIFVAPGQHFVYATLFSGPGSMVHIYIVDTTTWTLTEAPSSPLPGFTSVSGFVADPIGPFVYQSTATNQVRVYAVDLATGYLTEVAGSPFTGPGFGLPIAFSIVPGSPIQPVVGPVATLTPTNLVLGSSAVGMAATAQTVTLTSTGNQALSVNGIFVGGANAAEFSETDNCGAPTVLTPSNACFISVVFTPAGSGPRAAQLMVEDNAPGSPQFITLTGTGTGTPPAAPAITLSPGTVNFPNVALGASSSPLSVTVTNSGNAPLNISAITLGGNNPADFSAPAGNCTGAAIAPSATCMMTETFTPAATGVRQATLAFTDTAAGSPHFVTLTGTATAAPPTGGPTAKITPTSVNFPVTTQGLASVPITVTITNSGNAALHVSNIAAGGSSPADFTNSFTTCSSATIAAGANCTFNVAFSPIFSGPRSEIVSVTDDAANSPQTFNVSGNAPPAFAVTTAAAGLTATVSAGQTASYSVQLTPGTDFNGNVALTCGGAPLGATCQAPATVVLNTNAVAMFTVTVPTSGKATIFPETDVQRWPRIWALRNTPALVLPLILGVFILAIYRGAARPPVHRDSTGWHWRGVFAICVPVVLAVLLLALNGCVGSTSPVSMPQGNSLVTPSGTSIIVLTPATTNAAGKTLQLSPIQLTLVVN
ncbi:MAG TPA: choice-of-anchor D domain-containing protein [Candidatus Acidoferrum sp.]